MLSQIFQPGWLLGRCRQLRGRLKALSPDQMQRLQNKLQEHANLEQAGALLSEAMLEMGSQPLKWLDRLPARPDFPLIGMHQEEGFFLVHAKHPDGNWLLETQQEGSKRVLELPVHSKYATLPLAAPFASGESALYLIVQVVREHRPEFIRAALASVTANLLLLGTSLYSMQVYDRVIPSHGVSTLQTLTIGVVIAIMLEFFVKLARSAIMDHAIRGMDGRLSARIFERLLGVRMDQFPASVGTLSAQLRSYEQIRAFASSAALYSLVDIPFALVFLLVMLSIGGGAVTLVVGVFFVASAIVGLLARKNIESHTRSSMAASNKKLGLLVEAVEGAELIKAHGAGWQFLSKWNDLTEVGIREDAQVRHSSELATYGAGFLQQLSYAFLIAVGAWIAATSTDLTSGGLIACSIISGRVLSPIGMLPGLLVQWANAKTSIDNLERVFVLRCDNHEIEHPIEREQMRGDYELEGVEFGYPGAPASLKIQRFHIRPGDRVAVLGLIGSGKTTLLKLLAGLYEPAVGRVLLDGLDIQHISRSALSHRIGYVTQDVRLFSGTLRDNLLSGLVGVSDEHILSACEQTGLLSFIKRHPRGLDLVINEGGSGISGGQRQLVALTRQLLLKPAIWLLDEPTASMDESTEHMALRAIGQNLKAHDSLVLVTHKPSLLQLVNRIVVMAGGQIVLDGPRDEVLAKLQQGAMQQKAVAANPSAAQ